MLSNVLCHFAQIDPFFFDFELTDVEYGEVTLSPAPSCVTTTFQMTDDMSGRNSTICFCSTFSLAPEARK